MTTLKCNIVPAQVGFYTLELYGASKEFCEFGYAKVPVIAWNIREELTVDNVSTFIITNPITHEGEVTPDIEFAILNPDGSVSWTAIAQFSDIHEFEQYAKQHFETLKATIKNHNLKKVTN